MSNFDQLLQHNLPGNRLGRLHHCPQVQLLNRRADRGGRARSGLLFDRRVALVELLYLAQCAPTPITVTRVTQVGTRHFFDAALQVELGCQLVSDALVLHKPIFACCPNRLLVQPHGIKVSAFNPSQLSRHQCVFVGELR